MSKKIFILCLGLICAGLFLQINQANAAIRSCEFRCPDTSPTEAARGNVFRHESPGGSAFAAEIFVRILSDNCGFVVLGDETSDRWREFLVACECAEALSGESAETFDRDAGVCRFPEGTPATPEGTVSTPTTEETPTEEASPETYKAIPITGIDVPKPLGTISVPTLIGRVIKAVLGIIGSIALVMFIIGGFFWLTSEGNAQRVEKGKNILMWATIGLIVIFVSYAIVNFVISSLTSANEESTSKEKGYTCTSSEKEAGGVCIIGGSRRPELDEDACSFVGLEDSEWRTCE